MTFVTREIPEDAGPKNGQMLNGQTENLANFTQNVVACSRDCHVEHKAALITMRKNTQLPNSKAWKASSLCGNASTRSGVAGHDVAGRPRRLEAVPASHPQPVSAC